MKSRKNLITFIILLVFGLITLGLIYTGYIRFNYPSLTEFPIQGIDVSNHQKDIKWNIVDKNKVKFVFIKATEGGDFKDKRFTYNWKEAKRNQFYVGAYHFFTFCKPGREQAQNFIETVPLEVNNLPPVIDLEFGGNCNTKKSKEEILAEIDTLEQLIYQRYLKKPILYVTEDFYDKFLINKFMDNPIWFRDIYNRPKPKGNREWLFWQFGNRGHLKGIETYVDLNLFNGTEAEFQNLTR